ncbi:MAG: hypothetical protein AB7G17_00510 [Phycisphaerales bacterium]
MRGMLMAAGMAALCGSAIAADVSQPVGYGSLERWREKPLVEPVRSGVLGYEGDEVYVLRAGGIDGEACPEEPAIMNWQGAGNVTCPCFAAQEEVGAVLMAPSSHYPIEILRIGIGWGSQFGSQPDTLEDSLRIYPGGLPNPGLEQYETLGPLMRDGFINEFDISGTPGNRIINSGKFSVTLVFGVSNAGMFSAPSVVHDGNGCVSGRNLVGSFGFPGFWRDACSLGVSGDWVFQVVYRRVNCAAPCPGDTNGDRRVDFLDLNMVLSQFGQSGTGLGGDVSGDGMVNFVDLNIVLGAFGAMCG